MNNQNQGIPADAIHCISGLIYKTLKEGKGDQNPGPEDIVHVRLKKITGKYDPAVPDIQSLSVTKVNAGLSEAFQIMVVGQKLRVWIPSFLEQGKQSGKNEKYAVYEIDFEGFEQMKEPRHIPDHLISPRKKN